MSNIEILKKLRNPIIIFGSVRDYHAVDWYLNLYKINRNLIFVSDCNCGEGIENQMPKSHSYIQLFPLDILLLGSQSKFANLWRNILKILILPLNSILFLSICFLLKPKIIHAHPLYYGLICKILNKKYIVTPQGSEILVRAKKNYLYKLFAGFILRGAKKITTDSTLMKKTINNFYKLDSYVVQNGIDSSSILKIKEENLLSKDEYLLSFRAIYKNYRILEIVKSRNYSCPNKPIYFVYPSFDSVYINEVKKYLKPFDKLLGKVEKEKLYSLMSNSIATISIPISDSSPKSVYESIFSGAPTILQDNPYQDFMTDSMKSRVITINASDLKNSHWLNKSIKESLNILEDFSPCKLSYEKFDSELVLNSTYKILYT